MHSNMYLYINDFRPVSIVQFTFYVVLLNHYVFKMIIDLLKGKVAKRRYLNRGYMTQIISSFGPHVLHYVFAAIYLAMFNIFTVKGSYSSSLQIKTWLNAVWCGLILPTPRLI